MAKFIRGNDTKFTSEKHKAALEALGWSLADIPNHQPEPVAPAADDRDALIAEATALGLQPHHRTGIEKLKAMIAEAKKV
jgi:hypothetical protein